MPASSASSHPRKKAQVSSDDDERIIDGVRFPREERQFDQLGYETTKHALNFHGNDWDIPLTQRRDDLTKNFIQDAVTSTGEPQENIQNLRFVMNKGFIHVKFTVRHKPHVSTGEIQKRLGTYDWKLFKSLYEPREKQRRSKAAAHDAEALEAGRAQLSFFGRVREPVFEDAIDRDEEPVPHEDRVAARSQRTTSHLLTGGRMGIG